MIRLLLCFNAHFSVTQDLTILFIPISETCLHAYQCFQDHAATRQSELAICCYSSSNLTKMLSCNYTSQVQADVWTCNTSCSRPNVPVHTLHTM